MKLWITEKTEMVVENEMFQGFQKSTEICRYLFPSLRYFNFYKDGFWTEISKNYKIGKP